MVFLFLCFENAVNRLVEFTVFVHGHFHGQGVLRQAGPVVDPGFVHPAPGRGHVHQVRKPRRILLLVLLQPGLQIRRAGDFRIFIIPADGFRRRPVHDKSLGNAQLLVGGNAVDVPVDLDAVEEGFGKGFKNPLPVLLQLVSQLQQRLGFHQVRIVFPVGGEHQVHFCRFSRRLVGQHVHDLCLPVVPGNNMETDMGVDFRFNIFIDRRFHLFPDLRIVGIPDPPDIQCIRLRRKSGGHGSHHHCHCQKQGKQFTHVSFLLIKLQTVMLPVECFLYVYNNIFYFPAQENTALFVSSYYPAEVFKIIC